MAGAQQWQILYASAEQVDPEVARDAFQMARKKLGTWTLAEFKGWFNHNYPAFQRAGKFAALYVFYALYLAIKESDRVASQVPQGPRAGGPFRFYAPCSDPNASIVDAVFAKAERKRA